MTDNYRHALVAAFPNFQTQRHRPEQWYMVHLSQLRAAAFAEDVVTSSGVWGDEIAHVLDDAQNRNSNRFKHSERAAHVRDRHVLRRGNQHRALYRDKLRQ